MKKLLFFVVFLALLVNAAWGWYTGFPLFQFITVNYPNGGESFMAGTSQTVRWSYTGGAGYSVRIELLKGGALSRVIADAVPVWQGSYNWKLPPDQTPGRDYRIRVAQAGLNYSDTSDNDFTVVAIPPPSVVLDSPNGGEILTTGRSQSIRWRYTGDPRFYLRVELLKRGVVVRTLAGYVLASKGSFNWTPPLSQMPGNDYRIRVVGASDPSWSDISDSDFTIIAVARATDPSGDAFSSIYETVTPDLVEIKTVVDGSSVTFQIRFAPNTFDKARDLVTIMIDADRNPGTGRAGIDFHAYLGSHLYGSNASIERLTGGPNEYIGSAPVTFLADGMEVTFPLSYLQLQGLGSVTSFDYRIKAAMVFAAGGSSASVDTAPDIHLSQAATDRNSIHDFLSPIPTTSTAEDVRGWITNLNVMKPDLHVDAPLNCLVKWSTPIEVNTNGIPQAEKALNRYEALTGGLITFMRVDHIPANGIVFTSGDAVAEDGSPGCGNMTPYDRFRTGPNGNMTGLYFIHLGSSACNDATKGNYDSAVAEHEMGHALGVLGHFKLPGPFTGFNGDEGLMDPSFFNVIYNMYRSDNPVCTTGEALHITLVAVGDFGFSY